MSKFRDEGYLKKFGSHMRSMRLDKNLSQEDLAGLADTPLSQIGRLERGERAPTILTLLIISRALGSKPKELLDFE